MTREQLGQRFSFLGLIAWVSLCLLVAGWLTNLDPNLRKLWASAGLLGLASAVGLAASVKAALRKQQQLIDAYMTEATTDPLTGLANRRALDQELGRRVAQWQRQSVPLSVLLVDVDRFKNFNDTHGHQAGDQILRCIAKVLSATVRDMDLATRYGGEEFAVVLPGIDNHGAQIVAERIRGGVADCSVRSRGCALRATVSVGVAQAQQDDNPDTLVCRADEALYAAKEAGRNCVRVSEWVVLGSDASNDEPGEVTAGA